MRYESLTWIGEERRAPGRDGPLKVHFDALYKLVRAQPGRDKLVDDRLASMSGKIDDVKATVDTFEQKFIKVSTEGWTRVYGVIQRLDDDIKGELKEMASLIKRIPCEPIKKAVSAIKKRK